MKPITILLVLGALLVLSACATPPEEVAKAQVVADGAAAQSEAAMQAQIVAIDPAKSSFGFEGYGPGKSHVGAFNEFTGSLMLNEGLVVGAEGVVQASSVDTGIDGLDKHLRSDDFFDVEQYPTITFSSGSIVDGTMTGTLDFHGVQKTISFPVTVEGSTLKADFLLDITDFNIKYAAINKDVRFMLTMST